MVRRWSYLTGEIFINNYTGVIKGHRFKVFRKNTKFRKFNRGLIDFVRRKNIKRKRYMNYITLSFISSDWSKNYLNQRSIIRFSQSLCMHNFSLESSEPNLLIKLAKKHNFTQGFHTASIPSKRAQSILNNLNVFNINLSKTNFTRNALTSLNTFDKNSDTHNAMGLATYSDGSNRYFLAKNISLYTQTINLTNISFPTILSTTKSLRSILVLTSLLSFNS